MARILQVCNTDFYLTHFLAPLIEALLEEGYEVECACEGMQIPAGALPEGVMVHQVSFPRQGSPAQFLDSIGQLYALMARGDFWCVDSHNRNASIAARVAAWLARVPVNLYTAHGYYFHDDQGPLSYEATVLLERLLAGVTDHTLSQSEEDVSMALARRFAPPGAIEVIGNGIDVQRFSPTGAEARAAAEADLGLDGDVFRVGTIGRLVEGKGFGDMLEAFARLHRAHPRSHMLLIGGNIAQDIAPYEKRFMERVGELGLDNAITVTGLTDEVERWLSTCDLFVLPSYREGVPRSLIEAMAAGLPTIATDIRGCREATHPGVTGFLYPPHDVDRLAALMATVYDMGAAARGEMGHLGRRRAVDHFNEADYVQRQVDAINRLAGRG